MSDAAPPDFRSMSTAELQEWFNAEPDSVPLTNFPLHTDAGRQAFLQEFYMVGETSLFVAVNHIWDSLQTSRDHHCLAIGAAAATGGTGKSALRKFLSKFLAEALSINNEIPSADAFADLGQWHAAVIDTYVEDDKQLATLVRKYARLLNS